MPTTPQHIRGAQLGTAAASPGAFTWREGLLEGEILATPTPGALALGTHQCLTQYQAVPQARLLAPNAELFGHHGAAAVLFLTMVSNRCL